MITVCWAVGSGCVVRPRRCDARSVADVASFTLTAATEYRALSCWVAGCTNPPPPNAALGDGLGVWGTATTPDNRSSDGEMVCPVITTSWFADGSRAVKYPSGS